MREAYLRNLAASNGITRGWGLRLLRYAYMGFWRLTSLRPGDVIIVVWRCSIYFSCTWF